jgi:hypothetical protein
VLRAVRLTGAIYFDVQPACAVGRRDAAVSTICGRVMPDFEHVIAFHIMLDGWLLGAARGPAVSARATRRRRRDSLSARRPALDEHRGRRLGQPNMDLYYRPTDRPLPFVLSELGARASRRASSAAISAATRGRSIRSWRRCPA